VIIRTAAILAACLWDAPLFLPLPEGESAPSTAAQGKLRREGVGVKSKDSIYTPHPAQGATLSRKGRG
jgi:hypothetical protein